MHPGREGVFEIINHHLAMRDPDRYETSPSAAIIDSQSVRTTESGSPRGNNTAMKDRGPETLCRVRSIGVSPFCRPIRPMVQSPDGIAWLDLSPDGLIRRYSEVFDRGMALAQQNFAPERIARIGRRYAEALKARAEWVGHL